MNRTNGRAISGHWCSLAVTVVVAAPVVRADSPNGADERCPAATIEEARWLAGLFREQGVYQSAGQCYEAAGEYELANRAFLDAVQPQSEATARELAEQRDQARALLRQVQQAFRGRR
ncbi:MAG: hypothetical protein JO184_07860 [Gammaproteobacteria bacterium]|nr:hypothetical protein [Gammaproteobacteria bacterium]